MPFQRRLFLQAITGGYGAALFEPLFRRFRRALPRPADSGIRHIVVVTMENRSFDHLLGWLPGADGRQAGLGYRDRRGTVQTTYALGRDRTGNGHPDPSHSWAGGREQWNNGGMDGFLRSGDNDRYAIGYYGEQDRPFTGQLARHFTTCDRYFCSILGPTYPNRIFQHTAQTDRITNTFDITNMPTIWDRLAAAGVSRRYYYTNLPFLALFGIRHLSIARGYDDFLDDAAAGTLPAVSFVEPRFSLGPFYGNDDHPHADIARGDAFLSEVFHAVSTGPGWSGTVLIVNYDEWGGFFDHVPPPRVPAAGQADPDLVGGRALLGFRVPCIVASPFSQGSPGAPRISHELYDHTSVLKLIEWRFGLAPLTARDASPEIGNLAHALHFGAPATRVPAMPKLKAIPPEARTPAELAAPSAGAHALAAPATSEPDHLWSDLVESGTLDGWPIR